MNLRVDLILQTEKRSASAVSFNTVIRVAKTTVPAALLLFVALAVTNGIMERNELQMAENAWHDLDPRVKASEQIVRDFQAHRRILGELQLWQTSSRRCAAQLEAIVRETPADIQLRRLSIGQPLLLKDGKTAVRGGALTLEGMAAGAQADRNVETLRLRLQTLPAFTGLISTAEVLAFGADATPGAGRDDRAFRIEAAYTNRPLE